MTLFLITSISNLMLDILLKEKDALIVSPRQEIISLASELGMDAFHLSTDKYLDVKTRDAKFKELAMPGVFEDCVFEDTTLPIWQVLAIDRLKFWYSPENEDYLNFIDSLNWTKAFVSLDIGGVLPISVMHLAQEREAYCVAVRTEPIKTVELVDIVPLLTFNEYIVSEKEDGRFLKSVDAQGKITIREGEGPQLTDYPSKAKIRETLGIPEHINLSGIRFDKRDERQCRKALHIIRTGGDQNIRVWIFPVDERSTELAFGALYEYRDMIEIQLNSKLLAACDEIVSFRWDDNYCVDLPMNPIVFDIHGINKAEIIAPKNTDIQGLPT